MRWRLAFSFLLGFLSNVHGDEENSFITDIISSLRLISPTILYHGRLPEICMTGQWVLCLDQKNDPNELVEHIAMLYKQRKQDGVLFVGTETDQGLLENLAVNEPLMFRSRCPILMHFKLSSMIDLKLDSNILFYERRDAKYNLVDTFSVKGGPPIVLQLGTWDVTRGLELRKTMNRWERRTDLMGAVFINSLWATMDDGSDDGWANFNYDDNGTIIGSRGIFQEMLFYMTDRVNVTIITKDANKLAGRCPAMLEFNLTDVCSGGVPITGQPGESIPVHRQAQTLLAGVPKGSPPDAWVYLEVFGLPQWVGFFSLLLITSLAMKLTIAFSKDTIDNGAIVGLPTIYQYTIQGGSHPVSKQLAPRMISFTTGVVTLLMFIYYGNEITSKMTAGSPRHPVRTFDDVLAHGYRVIIAGGFNLKLLKNSPIASSKHMVYKLYFENDDPLEGKENDNWRAWYENGIDWAKNEIRKDPKTLFYCADSCVKYKNDTIVALKMHDSTYTMGGFGMQNNSEYLDMFNYYLLKEIEHGIVNRLWRPDPIAKIGINEPQPLGFKNVMFPFLFLGTSIVISVTIVAIEMVKADISEKKSKMSNVRYPN